MTRVRRLIAVACFIAAHAELVGGGAAAATVPPPPTRWGDHTSDVNELTDVVDVGG